MRRLEAKDVEMARSLVVIVVLGLVMLVEKESKNFSHFYNTCEDVNIGNYKYS
ncbi:MAG: hypothetical protein N2712_04995 [Brevinematales bacterium]|nr:hypothetical protein [Brevinematales bacterium]